VARVMGTPDDTAGIPATAPADNAPAAVTHASRRVPHCAACRHYMAGPSKCNHPALPVDTITGKPELSCRQARQPEWCGPEGTLFDGAPRGNAEGPPDMTPGRWMAIFPSEGPTVVLGLDVGDEVPLLLRLGLPQNNARAMAEAIYRATM